MEEKNIFSDFTNKDLQDLLNYGEKSLSYEQMEAIKKEIETRNIEPVVITKEKTKVLTRQYNGFASLLTLSLITGAAGTATFMYILMSIGA